MRIILFLLPLMLGLVSVGSPALASNWRFLDDTPITYFTKDDMRLFTKALRDGLENEADGAQSTWSNPDTGAGGTLRFFDTQDSRHTTCRRVEIANQAKGRENTSTQTFCRDSAGTWKTSP